MDTVGRAGVSVPPARSGRRLDALNMGAVTEFDGGATDDRAARSGMDGLGSPADDPGPAAAGAELRRALEAASPEDRAFVLGALEALARRLPEERAE